MHAKLHIWNCLSVQRCFVIKKLICSFTRLDWESLEWISLHSNFSLQIIENQSEVSYSSPWIHYTTNIGLIRHIHVFWTKIKNSVSFWKWYKIFIINYSFHQCVLLKPKIIVSVNTTCGVNLQKKVYRVSSLFNMFFFFLISKNEILMYAFTSSYAYIIDIS